MRVRLSELDFVPQTEDLEIAAIATCFAALQTVPAVEARQRVLKYLKDRVEE